jgi:hypothetical protein
MNKKLLLTLFLTLNLSVVIFASENKSTYDLNLSVGDAFFVMLNISRDRWEEKRLKFGWETNVVNRGTGATSQNVLDFKVYTGGCILKEKDLDVDLRIGYGVSGAYYASNKTAKLSYAPAVGVSLKYGAVRFKMMLSLYQNGISIPCLVGINTKKFFIGIQGIFALNISNNISSSFEQGVCLGFYW